MENDEGTIIRSSGPTPRRQLVIMTTSEWRAWTGRLARHCRINRSVLIDQALAHYSKACGFTEEPPSR